MNQDGSRWTKISYASAESDVWVKRTTDLAGRMVKEERPGYAGVETTEYFYNTKGQLAKVTRPGQADQLYVYDALGQVIREGLDINSDGELTLASTDRITETETLYITDQSDNWHLQTTVRTYATANSDAATTISISREQLTGLPAGTRSVTSSTDIHGNTTVAKVVVDRGNKLVVRTTELPTSSSDQIAFTRNGLLQSRTGQGGCCAGATAYAYDSVGRVTNVVDPRKGAAVTAYDAAGRVEYVEDAAGNQTTYGYDSATGRKTSESRTVNGQNLATYFGYTSHGQIEKTWGSATYPVSYEYDAYGRMTKMHTYRGGSGWTSSSWPGEPGTADTTEWVYDEDSGLLTAKKDAAGQSVSYTYSAGGKLASRTWARSDGTNTLVATYSSDILLC